MTQGDTCISESGPSSNHDLEPLAINTSHSDYALNSSRGRRAFNHVIVVLSSCSHVEVGKMVNIVTICWYYMSMEAARSLPEAPRYLGHEERQIELSRKN